MKIDWVRKLTSRKFWLAVASFVTLIVIAFGASDESASHLAAIIMAGATVIGYVIGEGLTDASSIEAQTDAQLEDKNELQ